MFPPDAIPDVIALSAILATTGWLYTARRARSLARKQHTINLIVTQAFDVPMRDAQGKIAIAFKGNNVVPPVGSPEYETLLPSLRLVLNHFEFIAAGIRRGDIDERLIIDAQRGTILSVYEKSEKHIFAIRNSRRRSALYEHLEWLHGRWERKPPGRIKRACEWGMARPFYGHRNETQE